MPCNAHGHPPSCNCGWGGVFHAPTVAGEYGAGYWSRAGSHTTPNAKCPVCKASVFFYRSSDNGRVYFDDLGPPWPKHPCTDNGSAKAVPFTTMAHKKGWWPFYCKSIMPLQDSVGSVLLDVDDRSLFTKQTPNLLNTEAPVWIRPLDRKKGEYEASTLTTSKGITHERRFIVFKDLALLESDDPNEVSPGSRGNDAGELGTGLKPVRRSRFLNSDLQRAAPPKKQKLTLPKTTKSQSKPSQNSVKVEFKTKTQKDSDDGKTIASNKNPTTKTIKSSATQSSTSPSRREPQLTAIQLAFSRLASTEDGQRALDELKVRRHG